jgi:hypothetical protein
MDTGDGILGTNMYAYCQGDPINMIDFEGTDAYYVVIYGDGGIPVVGHSRLFLQDVDGVWWVTEYTGYKKKDARVYTWEATVRDWDRMKAPRKGVWDGASNVLIPGDFTKSLELAKIYNKLDGDREKNDQKLNASRFGGGAGYNVLFNNCLHYVAIIMNESTGMPKPIADVFSRLLIPFTGIPSVFFAELLAGVRLSGVKK